MRQLVITLSILIIPGGCCEPQGYDREIKLRNRANDIVAAQHIRTDGFRLARSEQEFAKCLLEEYLVLWTTEYQLWRRAQGGMNPQDIDLYERFSSHRQGLRLILLPRAPPD